MVCCIKLYILSECVVLNIALLFKLFVFFFFKQKTAYEMRISDWSSDVCSSDLAHSMFAKLCSLPARSIAMHATGKQRIYSRSEERRVGKECVSTCRSRWSPYH